MKSLLKLIVITSILFSAVNGYAESPHGHDHDARAAVHERHEPWHQGHRRNLPVCDLNVVQTDCGRSVSRVEFDRQVER